MYLPPRALLIYCPGSLHSSLNFSNLDSWEIFLHRSLPNLYEYIVLMSIRYCIFFFLYYQWILRRVEYPQHKIYALQQHVPDALELESLSLGLSLSFKLAGGTSLVVQWLRINLLMQGSQVPSLAREYSICCKATKPVCHSYWVHALCNKNAPNLEKAPAFHN